MAGPQEEAYLKLIKQNPYATYFPEGSLEYITLGWETERVEHHLAWKFDIYAHAPLSRKDIYVDAQSGDILFEESRIKDADTTIAAHTMLHDTQTLGAYFANGTFCLEDYTRGDGVFTYTLDNQDDYSLATDICFADTLWDSTSWWSQYGTDAHYGTELFYDYLWETFGRNSIDDNGFALLSYIHFSPGGPFVKAFWDGERMTYGNGDTASGYPPLVCVNVAGHEITHGLTEFTANLVYYKESGALNESFSDVFGITLQHEFDTAMTDWVIGCGPLEIRDMSNPNLYGDPDTYLGTNWKTTPGDLYGVHSNSGVQNFWYYNMVEGGSGTNDLGNAYTVDGLGWDVAEQIAFRNLTFCLHRWSDYSDARYYAIQAATDLYGPCSPEVKSTWDAWYAVGVGPAFGGNEVAAGFISDIPEQCHAPHTVHFENLSYNSESWLWNFGDGNTSTDFEPEHTYSALGTYTVTLIASSTCGQDAFEMTDLINLDGSNPCHIVMPTSGAAATQTGCEGFVYDDGGPFWGYQGDIDTWITIAPTGTQSVNLYFNEVGMACVGTGENDGIRIYDGPDTNSPMVLAFCDGALPPASWISSGGAVTIRFTAEGSFLDYTGFEIAWVCNTPEEAPIAGFTVDRTYSCSGIANFTNQSALGPNTATSWFWDFGDGNTSTLEHPSHTYQNEGVYTVKCAAINSFGTDTMTIVNLIEKALPLAPTGPDVEVCPGDQATLIAFSTGTNYWYDSDTGSTVLAVGDTFITPIVNQSTPFYAENYGAVSTDTTGAPDKFIGTGANTSLDQGLYFNALSDFRLHAVTVYTLLPGDRHIFIQHPTNGVVHDTTINIATGEVTLLLDFDIEAGQDYLFKVDNTQMNGLWRNNGGVEYPYEIPGTVSIYGSTAGPGFYYWFYNWQVQELCTSEREMISASTGECTGVDELTADRYQLFPNPTDRMMTVQWSGLERPQSMQLYSASGTLARMIPVPHSIGQVDLDLAGLSQGVYFLQINEGANIITKRVVIQ